MSLNEKRAARVTGTARRDQRPSKDTETLSSSMVTHLSALRRRRAASDRLEPLANGVRDPFDSLARTPVRRVEYGTYDVTTLGLNCTHGASCTAQREQAVGARQADEQRGAA